VRLFALVLLTACGRIGFGLGDEPPGVPSDGPVTDGMAPDSPPAASGLVDTSVAIDDTSGSSITTSPNGTTSGNLLVAMVHWVGDASVFAVSDGGGNFFTALPVKSHPSVGKTQIWYANDILGLPSNVVTVAFAGQVTRRRLLVHEYNGIKNGDAIAGDGGAFGSGDQQAMTPSVGGNANVVMVASCFLPTPGSAATFAPGPNFTLRLSGAMDSQTQDRVLPAAALTNATIAFTPPSNWILQFAMFARE
jgi:hypothetical protein